MLTRLLARFSALVLLLAAICGARAAQPPLMETLRGERPVRLQSLQVGTAISGGMAETTLTMVFHNPNPRALEGQLRFPLVDGQQVTAFALDIDGAMRPAVPVEKSRGRQILEEVERQGIDPALLEQTQGNNFKLRVYPIPAQGTRTVELSYAEPLAREGGDWVYRMPLGFADGMEDFAFNAQVQGAAAAPRASGALGSLTFDAMHGGYRTHLARSGFSPDGALLLRIPAPQRPQVYVQRFDGETYFVAEAPVSARRAARKLPRVVGLLWDSSGSGAGRAHGQELALLDRYFKALGQAEVRLVQLRDRAGAAQSFQVQQGRWDALRKALRSVDYDGASALADWKPQTDVNEYLLVSDGMLNYGAARFPPLARGQRLYAINSAASADTGRLAAVAERTGGALVRLGDGQEGAAAETLLTDGPRVQGLRADGAGELLVDSGAIRQGLVRVAGKLTGTSAQVAFTLEQQGGAVDVQVAVDASSPMHRQAAWLWAGYKLRELEGDFESRRAAIRRLGAKFGIPTRETSLLVLDRMEDYVRHDVTPPPSMRAAYEKLRAERGAMLAQRRHKQLESVVRQFEQKVAWWERGYPKTGPKLIPYPTPLPPPPPMEPGADARRAASMAESAAKNATRSVAARDERRAAPAYSPPPIPAPAPMMTGPRLAMPLAQDAAPAMEQAGVPGAGQASIGIALKKWSANAPYIARMKAAAGDALYTIYLDERPSWSNSSAFYLDAADMLAERGQRELALRVLSNLAEMELENRHVLRILGYRLLQMGEPALAIPIFEQVRLLAEEEPQSFRDLGLAYAAAGRPQQAVEQLHEVVMRPWDGRFAEIELIALAEMNAVIAAAPARSVDTGGIDSRLLRNLPLDVRAVMTWDADNSDMDLWVTDPNGEKCYYGHRDTRQGGRMSRDFTGGYGPEEFSLRVAKPGKYRVEANFFGDRQQLVAGATTLQLRLTTGFGTSAARDQMVTLRLKGQGSTVLVGEFEVR